MKTPHGWGVQRWQDTAPLYEGLATKSEAFKLLYALTYAWASIRVRYWTGGESIRLNLTQFWERRPWDEPR